MSMSVCQDGSGRVLVSGSVEKPDSQLRTQIRRRTCVRSVKSEWRGRRLSMASVRCPRHECEWGVNVPRHSSFFFPRPVVVAVREVIA
eukprot:scaffold1016_cov258-Pinguiococcus_pyrenoidosus.AAC.19